MDNEPVPRWITGVTTFLVIGLACVTCLYTAPDWAHLVRLPARAARPPTATSTTIPTTTATATAASTRPVTVIPVQQTRQAPSVDTGVSITKYKGDVSKHLTNMGEALRNLGGLLQNAQIGNDEWTVITAAQLAVIQLSHDSLANLHPPPVAERFHADLLDATSDCRAATRQLSRGIDDLDSSFLESAKELMESCGAKMELLNDDFAALQ